MLSLLLLLTCSTAFAFSRIRANSAFVTARTGDASALQMSVKLDDLPYAYTALEPHIGEQTLRIHHGKHHARYVTVTNELVQNTDMAQDDLITLIRKAHAQKHTALFNNAGQVFNHDFYWKSMKANGGGEPKGPLLELINRDFGSFASFREAFVKAATTVFGSGWAWLVLTPQGLKITQTIGAGNPYTEDNQTPLLTLDVWEHAYYLDYQNLRPNYIETFFNHLVDWDAVSARLPK